MNAPLNSAGLDLLSGNTSKQDKRRGRDRRLLAAIAPLFKARRPVFERLEDRTLMSVAGDLDQTFGAGGLQSSNFTSNGNDEAYAIALQGSNYVVAGSANGQGSFGLSRYSASGSLLSRTETPVAAPGQAQAVAVLPDGSILAAGYSFSLSSNFNFTLVKYTSSGALDTSWGTGGVVTTAISNRSDQAFAIATQPTGGGNYKILVGGGTFTTNTREAFAVVRYQSDGTLDNTFGTGGIVISNIGASGSGELHALAVSGNTLYAGGQGQNSAGNFDFSLARYDLANNGNFLGLTQTDFLAGSDDRANALAIDAGSGAVYLGGVTGGAAGNFAIARYSSAGTLDNTFGPAGTVTTVINSGLDAANGLAVQYNGKVLLTGYTTTGTGDTNLALVRYNTNGQLDANFGVAGKVTTSTGAGTHAAASAVVIDGTKAVVAGSVDTGINGASPDDFLLARFQLNNAPTLGAGSTSVDDIVQNDANSPGTTVSTLVNAAHLNGGDVDGDVVGLAITGATNAGGNGAWQFSLNGTTWTALPVVGVNSALLLAPSALVRFVPTSGYNTSGANPEPTLTVVAWDQTIGTNGGTGDTAPVPDNQFAAFGASPATVSQNIVAAQNVVYVDDSWTGSSQGQSVSDDFGTHTFGIDAFSSIQDGVTFVASGGTVHVDDGSYAELVNIAQPLQLLGPNDGINPNTGIRNPEARVTTNASVPDPDDNNSSSIIYVESSNVTIKGLLVDGDNTSLSGGVTQNGANVDAIEGIASYAGVGGITITNNIVRNLSYAGLDFYNFDNGAAPTGGSSISQNKFDNIGYAPYGFGVGVLLYNNFYASVSNNVMTAVRLGVQTGNFNLADPGSDHAIINNTIEATAIGIFHNLAYQSATAFTISGNSITALDEAGLSYFDGIEVASIQSNVGVVLQNNSVTVPNTVTQTVTAGYEIWANHTTAGITINGGTITGAKYGVFANNYDGYASPAGGASSLTIDGVAIVNSGSAGVYVRDNALDTGSSAVNVNLTGNTSISGGPIGLLVEGAAAHVTMSGSVGNPSVSFTGQSGDYIKLQGNATPTYPGGFDATTASFAGVQGNALSQSQAYAVENKITDALDNGSLGFVRIRSGQVDVTSTGSSGAIQRGVNAASPGDTVNVQDGTYKENVTIGKALVLRGANAGIAGDAARSAESNVVTNGAQNAVFTVTSNNVTIDGFAVDGDDTLVTGGALTSGEDSNALYGVRPSGGLSGLTVQNNIVKRVFIGVRGDGAGSGNTITRNWFDSVGAFDFGYAVSLRSNFYADVTDNKMTRVQTGMHTNNFQGAGPAQFLFQGNDVQTYGAGVWDNLQYNGATSLTIDDNTITALTSPLSAAGRANFDGKTIGIMLVTLQDNVSATITNNTISGMAYGVLLYNTVTSATPVLGSSNTITNNGAGVYLTNIVGFNPVSTTVLGGAANNPTGAGKAILNGVTLSGNTTGVLVRGDNASTPFGVSLNTQGGTSITGGTTGLRVTGAAATISGNTLADTSFTGQSGDYITLAGGAAVGLTINATAVSFDGSTGAAKTLAQNFATEDKLTHAVDDATLGFVRIKSGNVFVTPNTFVTPAIDATGAVQRAVNAASSGDVVNIQNGVYPGQVEVAKSITLLGQSQAGAIIRAVGSLPLGFTTSATFHPVVYIHDTTATVQQLTVDGNGQGGGSNNRIVGIGLRNAGGTIDNVTIEHVRQSPLNGVQEGEGIRASNGDAAPRSLTISDSTIYDYQKNGMTLTGAGLVVTVTGNSVSGAGPTTAIAQNGIQVSGGATGDLSGNTISGHAYNGGGGGADPVANVQSTGVLIFDSDNVTVSNNTIDGNDIGIYNFGDSTSITSNTLGSISENRYEGILQDEGSSTISGNTVTGGNIGVAVISYSVGVGPAAAVLSGNTISGADVGVMSIKETTGSPDALVTASGNTITGNGVGLQFTAGKAMAQYNDLTGNTTGVIVSGGAIVDLGDASNSNTTGLGSSAGQNTLSGYTGAGSSYAIDDQNLVTQGNHDVLAQLNDFGPYVNLSTIAPVILDGTDIAGRTLVDYSQALNQQPAPAVVYVDDDWTGFALGADPDGLGPATQYGVDAFAIIQDGLNGVATSGLVQVYAGMYRENPTLSRAVTLLGANAGIAGAAGRGAESIIQTAASDPDPFSSGAVNVVSINANNVTIDGFLVDGDNTTLVDSGVHLNGATIDAAAGIASVNSGAGLTVRNNIVRNTSYVGLDFENLATGAATSGNLVTSNLVENLGDDGTGAGGFGFGLGILVGTNFYADVTNNVIQQVRVGVQTDNYYNANPGATGSISNNLISARRAGIWNNLSYSAATGLTIAGNSVTAESASLLRFSGIWITSIAANASPSISGNTITVGAIAQSQSSGYEAWNDTSPAGITITGGTVSGAKNGVWVNNFDSYPTSTGSNGGSTSVIVSGVTITGAVNGVYIKDNASNTNSATVHATITDDTDISTNSVNGTGIKVEGPDASATVTGNDDSINGNFIGIDVNAGSATVTGNHIYDNTIGVRLISGGTATVTGNNFEGGASADNVTDLFIDSTAGLIAGGSLSGNSFAGSKYYVDFQTNQDLDATGATFSTASNFRIEDRMHHRLDSDLALTNGRITWVSDNVFVTAPGTASSGSSDTDSSIQRGINAASVDDTVNVEAGTFTEQVNVNKRVTLSGAGAGIDARTRSISESVLQGPGGVTALQISVSDATVDGFTVQGNTNSNVFGAGVYMTAGISGTQFLNNVVQNNIIGLFLANSSSTDQAVLSQNLFRNNTNAGPGSGQDIYADNFTAGGVLRNVLIQNNAFTNSTPVTATWGIGLSNAGAAPFTDITISGNDLTNTGRGMYFYGSENVAITGNSIDGAARYGIGLFGSNGTPANTNFTITGNTFTNDAEGIELFDDAPGTAYSGPLTFSGNTFASTTAIYIYDGSTYGIDATQNTYGGYTPTAANLPAQYALADRMIDAIDVPGYGLVNIDPTNLNIYVTPNSFSIPDGTTAPSVQRGVNAAASGQTVHVQAGTYGSQGVDFGSTRSGITLKGDGQGATIINATGYSSALDTGGINVQANNVTLEDFTLIGSDTNPPRYGIKSFLASGLNINHVTVQDMFRTGIDLNGVSNSTVSDVQSLSNGGAGIASTDGHNIHFSNITTSGNPWAGITIATMGRFAPLGTSGIVIDGTNSFGESGSANGGLQLEAANYNSPLSPIAITWSTVPGDNANVTIQNGDFAYALGGPQDQETINSTTGNLLRTKFFNTLAQAQSAAAGSPDHFQAHDRFIRTTNGFAQQTTYHVYDDAASKMSIQAAVNDSKAGDLVNVHAGTFVESVNLNKALIVTGDAPATTTISGAVSGDPATVRISAANVTLQGFTITREGNNTTDWNNPALKSAGVAVQGTTATGVTITGNIITGNRSGIDLNNVDQITVYRNDINNNRTGLIMRNAVTNTQVTENFIDNNWTKGMLFLDTSPVVADVTGSSFIHNHVAGNWYGQIENRATNGGAKPFYSNWLGTSNVPAATSTTTGGEPGYAGQIPVAFGGTATPPASSFTVQGNLAGTVFAPWLSSGVDTSGAFGFQPDLSALGVDISGPASINEGSTYTLALSPANPGVATISSWVIDWGDGSTPQNVTGNPTSVTHVYTDGANSFVISATASTVDGPATSNMVPVTVNNVGPTVTLAGPTSAAEGQTKHYTFTTSDPGSDSFSVLATSGGAVGTVSNLVFDGNTGAGSFDVTFSDGIASSTVSVQLQDSDGDASNVSSVVVNVGNVAPTLTLSGPSSVAEGATYTLSLFSSDPGDDTVTWTINWGDGSPAQVVPATGRAFNSGTGLWESTTTATHAYANGPQGWTISATATDEDGTYNAGNTIAVNVTDVEPTVALTGSHADTGNPTPNVAENGVFTLTIGPVVDPGSPGGDTVQKYIINWGDGSAVQEILAANLPANRQVTHQYLDGTSPPGDSSADYTVHVDILDNDGYHADAGTLGVVVTNVAPTASLGGSASVSEGSSGSVSFFGQSDVSSVDQAAGFTYSYDFDNNGTFEVVGTTSSTITVPASFLADGPASRTVRGRIIDKDGGFSDALKSISVNNVTPVVNPLSNVTVNAGASFTQAGSFTDPGADSPWQVYVNYDYDSINNPGQGSLVQSGPSKNFTIGTTYSTAGSHTVRVTVIDKDGAAGTGEFTVSVNATTYQVTNFTPTASGFDVTFNRPVTLSGLNLYSSTLGTLGVADVSVIGNVSGAVRGSLVWDTGTNTAHFVSTGGILPDQVYSVTLFSRADGWVDTGGHTLDGDANNSDGGNYFTTFGISHASPPRVLSLPDFARGPGQNVNVPALSAGAGLPVTLSDGSGVLSVDFDVVYNPALLNVTSASLAAGVPGGWSLTMNFVSPGRIKFTASGTTALPGGPLTLIRLSTSIPQTAPYASAAQLQLQNVSVNENNIASAADIAVQKVAYLGDATGNALYTGLDSAYISRVVVALDSGFDAYPLVDPTIVGDATGDGSLSGLDASYVAQKSIGLLRPEIPDVPTGFTITTGGVDPNFTAGSHVLATRGGTVTVPIDIDNSTGYLGGNIDVGYTSGLLNLVNGNVNLGSLLSSGWTIFANVLNGSGEAHVVVYNSTANATGPGNVANLVFSVPSNANPDVVPITLSGPATDGPFTYNYFAGSVDIPPTFTGTGADDHYTVGLTSGGSTVQVWENDPTSGPATYTFASSLLALTNFSTYRFNTLGGNDTLTIDYTNGDPLGGGGVIFDGGANSDTLILNAPTGNNAFTVNASGISFGSTPLDTLNDESIVINTGAGNDTVTQSATPATPFVFNGGTGSDTININAASHNFSTDASATTANLTVNVNGAGSSVSFASNQHLTALNLASGGTAAIVAVANPSAPSVVTVTTLSFAGAGSALNVTNNELITTASASAVRTQIGAGQIYTTSTSSGPSMGLGYASIGGGQTKVRFSLIGDTDLNGTVDISDLGNLASSYGALTGALWENGDTNNNGDVDVNDLGNFATNYGLSLGTGASSNAQPAAQVASNNAALTQPATTATVSGAKAGKASPKSSPIATNATVSQTTEKKRSIRRDNSPRQDLIG